jgi:hypothetical protein
VVASFVGVTRLGQTIGPVAFGAGLAAFGSEAIFLAGAALAVGMTASYPLFRRLQREQEIAEAPANPVP